MSKNKWIHTKSFHHDDFSGVTHEKAWGVAKACGLITAKRAHQNTKEYMSFQDFYWAGKTSTRAETESVTIVVVVDIASEKANKTLFYI